MNSGLDMASRVIDDVGVSMSMLPRSGLIRARGRGLYDRGVSRERRQAEQRDRLLLATATAFRERRATVDGVVQCAGVGRNTFYEYFDDFAHALAAVKQRALSRISTDCEHALAVSRQQGERTAQKRGSERGSVRAVCSAFCASLLASADDALVVLCSERSPAHALSPAGEMLAHLLSQALPEREPSGAGRLALQLLAAAAATEAVLLDRLAQREQAMSVDETVGSVLVMLDRLLAE
jgi:AcrR family transcriptional regulator